MKLKHVSLLTLIILTFAVSTSALAKTYFVNRTLGQATVTGYIETDGTFGAINFSNIVDYHLEIAGPNFTNGALGIIDISTSPSYLVGTSMSATPTDLLFDTTGGGFIIWWTDNHSHFWCLETSGCNTGFPSETLGYTDTPQANTVAQPAEFSFASAQAAPVPTLSAYGLVLTMLALAFVASRRLRASNKHSFSE